VSVQDRCAVCAERTTGSDIVLDAHDGTTRLSNHFGCTSSANVPEAKILFSMHPMELLDDKAQVEARFRSVWR
jgi:hypothetical protein